jgi:hypothetical protein
MSEPVYMGMPPVEREFTVRRSPAQGGIWGRIICGGKCRDDYARLEVYHQTDERSIILQRAALKSFRDAEDKLGFKIWLTGSIRSCDVQARLYRSDPNRFARPDTTGHTRGLCIDVSQNQSPKRLRDIDKALSYRGWHQSRPIDEPWHYSFGIQV